MTSFIKNVYEKKIGEFTGACFQCTFSTETYTDESASQLLGGSILKSLSQALPKRKSEFVAGRYMAQKALKAVNSDHLIVAVGTSREPIWPTPFIGSISHSGNEAICAVAKKDKMKMIGIDIENIIGAQIISDIYDNILVESEIEYIGNKSALNPLFFTLIYSAKESLFKALYPEVKFYFGFSAARMKSIDMRNRKFNIELVQDISQDFPKGSLFEGKFEFNNNKVFTMIAY